MTILVVLVACSIVSLKDLDPDLGTWQGLPPHDFLTTSVVLCYECLNRMLIPWPPGVLMMRLAHPRPSGIRLWRQPGFVASTAATSAIGLELVHSFVAFLYAFRDEGFWNYFWSVRHDEIRCAVFGAWAIMILSRRWQAEAGWVDRFGRGIGFLWIGLLLSAPIEWFLN